MTAAKMLRVLKYLEEQGPPSSPLLCTWIHSTGGGELAISIGGQLERHVHFTLLGWGFITNESGEYIYRPRK